MDRPSLETSPNNLLPPGKPEVPVQPPSIQLGSAEPAAISYPRLFQKHQSVYSLPVMHRIRLFLHTACSASSEVQAESRKAERSMTKSWAHTPKMRTGLLAPLV